jgi:hypothetical protein
MVLLAECTSVEPGKRSTHWVGKRYSATLTAAAAAAAGLAFIREINLYVTSPDVFRSENCLSVFVSSRLIAQILSTEGWGGGEMG